MLPFSLVKWYLDCVTDDGQTAILYCADLRWRGLSLSYSSLLHADGQRAEQRSSMAPFRLQAEPQHIDVAFPRLHVAGSWQAAATPCQLTVYACAAGSVHWNCLQPASRVSLRIGERELTGWGYAECLTLTLPPWELPMRQLRWGRFVCAEETLAWIDWQGPFATSIAFHNGSRCALLSASEEKIVAVGATLRMDESRTLRQGEVGKTVLPASPCLRRFLPRSIAGIEERKWRSRGSLQTESRTSRGWVIHEVVDWNQP